MKELKLLLRVLITPSIWVCYGAYCKTWDGLIREQLIDNVAVDFDMETVGNVVIDLDSNYFGTSKNQKFICYGWRGSRRTLLLLKDYIEKATIGEYRKKFNKITKAMK